MGQKGFEGWYFKHQKGSDMLAFIPGRAESGAFVQMMSSQGARRFAVPDVKVENGVIRAGACLFSAQGCKISLPGVWGEIAYGPLQLLHSDIMGPFRFLPMECRHGILSMAHETAGSISVEGTVYRFDGGTGYIEKDSGRSFPRDYLWVQCNTFREPGSLVLAVAKIPFCGLHFRGCICAIVYGGREYRFATYNGVRILAFHPQHIRLVQGSCQLELFMHPSEGHSLASPVKGRMSGTVRECCNARIRARLWENGREIFDLSADTAAYEFVPEAT